jgi:hypothetical protein
MDISKIITKLNIRIMYCRSGDGLMSYGYSFIQIGGYKGQSHDDVKSEELWDGDYSNVNTVLDCRLGKCNRISKLDLENIIKEFGMTQKDELDDITRQINELQIRKTVIQNEIDKVVIDKRKEEFETIRGKIFWFRTNGFNTRNHLEIIKVVDCYEWFKYNSCEVIKFNVTYDGDIIKSITHGKDSSRVDHLVDAHITGFNVMTEDKLVEIINSVNDGILNLLNTFK